MGLTEAVAQWVADLHAVSPDGGTVLAQVEFRVCVADSGFVSVVRGHDGLGCIVARIASANGRCAYVDHKGRRFVCVHSMLIRNTESDAWTHLHRS